MIRNPLTDLAADRRGVSEVIGAILVFGLVIALLTIVQTQAVPSTNEAIEFEHSKQVQGDLADLRGTVSRVAKGGGEESVAVAMGTSYPPRLVLFNPPPAQGTLRTGVVGGVTIDNVEATNAETADYLSGTVGDIDSRSLSYRVDYNRHQNAPRTVYEYGAVVNEYENGDVVVKSPSTLVSGRTISLVTLTGDLSESSVEETSVDVRPVSASSRTVSVSDNGGPVTLTIPTRLSEEVWVEQMVSMNDPPSSCDPLSADDFADEFRYVVGCSYDDSTDPNSITLRFEQGRTYELKTSRVSLDGHAPDVDPHYVTTVDPMSQYARPAEGKTLTFEVRDRYNNPVSGVELTLSTTSGSVHAVSTGTQKATTDENGRITAIYRAPPMTGSYGVSAEVSSVSLSGGRGTATHEVIVGYPDHTEPEHGVPSVTTSTSRTCTEFQSLGSNGTISPPVGSSGSNTPLVCAGTFHEIRQFHVYYDVSDAPAAPSAVESGIDYVEFRIKSNESGTVDEIATYRFSGSGETSLGNTWVSPWINDDWEGYDVEVFVRDRSGKTNSSTVTFS